MRTSNGPRCPNVAERAIPRLSAADYSKPAPIISSVTFLLLSLEGSILGACRSASGTSLGLDWAPIPTAYSYECRCLSTSWPFSPTIHFRNLSLGLMLARRQHAAARDADERARVLVAEVVQRRIVAVLAGLGLIAEVVVVVDDGAVEFHARVHGLQRRAVAPKGGGVLLHGLEPGRGRGLALELQQRADDGLEVRARSAMRPNGPSRPDRRGP